MDIVSFLRQTSALDAIPGHEQAASDFFRSEFQKYTADTWQDGLLSAFGRIGRAGEGRPRVLLAAHQDENGLLVTEITKEGFLRITRDGGMDPRILPGHEVTVYGRKPLYGVVGATPPHLLKPEDKDKALKFEDLSIDIGMSYEQACQHVRVGDCVALKAPLLELQGGRFSGKAMDDRACVGILLATMERLRNVQLDCEAIFMASSQEEVGDSAGTAAFALEPDIAIALDVSFATADGVPYGSYPAHKPTIAIGPNMHPALTKRLRDCAKREGIAYSLEPAAGATGTDAYFMQIARNGIPCALMGVPVHYMHTSVEVLDIEGFERTAQLLAAFLSGLDKDWRDWLCF